jgi:uncharacterized membrane protein YebE (DUF533 family)
MEGKIALITSSASGIARKEHAMFDAKRLLFGLVRSAMSGSRPHRVRQGLGRSSLGGVGMGMLGSLAMTALQSYMQQQSSRSSGAATVPSQPLPSEGDDEAAYTLIYAMIAAAKADGAIDYKEQQRTLTELTEAGADDEARAFVQREMERPLDLDALVSRVQDERMAEEVYAASLLAIEVDTPAEQHYLQDLAARLHLDAQTVTQLHDRFDVPRQS